jgi:transcriptional regulator GlxA family with amidase domain
VAVVAFDRISPFHLAVPCLVFGEQGDLAPAAFALQVCAAEPGPLRTTAGFEISTGHGLEALAQADWVVIPSWRDTAEPPPARLCDALVRAHRRGARLVGLCLGAFVLAEAGLLDGRTVTTHWQWTAEFARRYPGARVDPQVLYLDDGDIVTSAGTAAGLDCCLHLLRGRCGAEVAARVARRLVVAPHRHGGQAQYIEQPLAVAPLAAGDRLQDVLQWALAHLAQPHRLDDLAARARMGRRTFTRQFRKATGGTVGQWLLAQRVALAQRLLETTDRGIDRIAADAGFGSAASLRQHFSAAVGVPPTAYRRGFRA